MSDTVGMLDKADTRRTCTNSNSNSNNIRSDTRNGNSNSCSSSSSSSGSSNSSQGSKDVCCNGILVTMRLFLLIAHEDAVISLIRKAVVIFDNTVMNEDDQKKPSVVMDNRMSTDSVEFLFRALPLRELHKKFSKSHRVVNGREDDKTVRSKFLLFAIEAFMTKSSYVMALRKESKLSLSAEAVNLGVTIFSSARNKLSVRKQVNDVIESRDEHRKPLMAVDISMTEKAIITFIKILNILTRRVSSLSTIKSYKYFELSNNAIKLKFQKSIRTYGDMFRTIHTVLTAVEGLLELLSTKTKKWNDKTDGSRDRNQGPRSPRNGLSSSETKILVTTAATASETCRQLLRTFVECCSFQTVHPVKVAAESNVFSSPTIQSRNTDIMSLKSVFFSIITESVKCTCTAIRLVIDYSDEFTQDSFHRIRGAYLSMTSVALELSEWGLLPEHAKYDRDSNEKSRQSRIQPPSHPHSYSNPHSPSHSNTIIDGNSLPHSHPNSDFHSTLSGVIQLVHLWTTLLNSLGYFTKRLPLNFFSSVQTLVPKKVRTNTILWNKWKLYSEKFCNFLLQKKSKCNKLLPVYIIMHSCFHICARDNVSCQLLLFSF